MNCVCTIYDDNFKPFMPYVVKTLERFADIHGYSMLVRNNLIEPSLHPSWNKLLMMLDAFRLGYEWVLWVDADSLYIGQEPKLHYVADFMTSGDANGLCCGHMLVKNVSFNRRLFETLLFLGDVNDDSKFGDGPKWEQNALKALNQHWNIPISFLPRYYVGEPLYSDTINEENQFLHFAVMDNQRRCNVIREIYENWNHNTGSKSEIHRICKQAIQNHPSVPATI